MRRVLMASAALLMTTPAMAAPTPAVDMQAAAAGLQAMRELNLIVFGDLLSGHEVEGKTFIGGNISGQVENFGIGNATAGAVRNDARATLTVGGTVAAGIQLANGANGRDGRVSGNGTGALTDSRIDIGRDLTGTAGSNVGGSTLRTGGSLNAQNYNPNPGRTASYGTTVTGVQPQDRQYVTRDGTLADAVTGLARTIADEAAALLKGTSSLSALLGGLTSNATLDTRDANNIHLDYAASAATDAFVVANVTADDLFGRSGTLLLDLLGNATSGYKTTVINVTGLSAGRSYAYRLNNNDNQRSNNQNVIWNFAAAPGGGTSIALETNFNGSVLAPYAGLSNSTQLNGTVVAGSFRQGGEVHLGTYAGTDAFIPAAAVPEPAAWAMMMAGFGAIGATLRRRGPRRASGSAVA